MFKVDCEKTRLTYQLLGGIVEKMVHLAYPNKKFTSHKLIAAGCTNLNCKIQLRNENKNLF